MESLESTSKKKEDENVRILDAFHDFPKPKWNPDRKIFYTVSNKNSHHSSAESKISVFKDRYYSVLQRLKRSSLFSTPTSPLQLTPVDALMGSNGIKSVLGLLTQLKEGQYHIEDPKGSVPIRFEDAEFSAGMYTEGEFIVVVGQFIDSEGYFRVNTAGFPPSEPQSETKKILGGLDLFAPPRKKAISSKYSMFQVEDSDSNYGADGMEIEIPEDSEFVILSDFHLDQPLVIEKFKQLLTFYKQNDPPTMLILMGNFTSIHRSPEDSIEQLRFCLTKLGNMIESSFRSIALQTKIIFIPGPSDPGGSIMNILPKPALPKVVTEEFLAKIPNAQFVSNPCRIRYYGKDYILFRDNLLNKMVRNKIVVPKSNEELPDVHQHLVKTICDQGHLSPFPISIQPVYWQYDHALHVYPLPDALIIGDIVDQYETTYDGCHTVNTGSFAVDHSFIAFRPAEKLAHFSKVDDDMESESS